MFRKIQRQYRHSATFEVPKNSEREYPALDIHPLTVRVTDKGIKGQGYDVVMTKATGRVKRAINNLWRRNNQGDDYYLEEEDLESSDSDTSDY